jgi:hypothetical protein
MTPETMYTINDFSGRGAIVRVLCPNFSHNQQDTSTTYDGYEEMFSSFHRVRLSNPITMCESLKITSGEIRNIFDFFHGAHTGEKREKPY